MHSPYKMSSAGLLPCPHPHHPTPRTKKCYFMVSSWVTVDILVCVLLLKIINVPLKKLKGKKIIKWQGHTDICWHFINFFLRQAFVPDTALQLFSCTEAHSWPTRINMPQYAPQNYVKRKLSRRASPRVSFPWSGVCPFFQ